MHLKPIVDVVTPLILFCGSHIWLSNVREPIIDSFGSLAASLNAVGTDVKFPTLIAATSRMETTGEVIPDVKLWPTEKVAGRQIFRIFYSAIAVVTLASSLVTYNDIHQSDGVAFTKLFEYDPSTLAAFVLASVAQGVSLASLANPSPLSLVPAFVPDEGKKTIVRDDSLKLNAYGLTRITRHPLILPVLPWGIGNAILAGNTDLDWTVFGGLGVYAVLGCWAQDQRAQRSAAVGTVFAEGDLTNFYKSTSFTPFKALFDGRQRWGEVGTEVFKTWPILVASLLVGALLELQLVKVL